MTKVNQTISNDAAGVPRLAMINDIAGFGRCSTAVSLPVISVLGVQVCSIPTAVLSNHFGFPVWHFDDYTPHMRSYIEAWKSLALSFDGLYCGFLGNVEQFPIVEEFLDAFRPKIFLLDPVMGDHGKAYKTITRAHCLHMEKLIERADILTPNLTEACLLTDTPYREDIRREEELLALCSKLSQKCPGKIVITGVKDGSMHLNYIWENERLNVYPVETAGNSRPGTGDLFASILAAEALKHADLSASVKKAADFIALCIRGSEKAGVPIQEGVLFEKYLRSLF